MILALWVFSAFAGDPVELDVDLRTRDAQKPAPAAPAGPEALLASRAFRLTIPYRSAWRADHPLVAHGRLVALRLPPAFAVLKDIGTPVLYADDAPAEVLVRRGVCVVVVAPATPLDAVLWSFGPDTPAGEVTPAEGAQVRDAAARHARKPLSAPAARPDLTVADADALWRAAEAMASEVCR